MMERKKIIYFTSGSIVWNVIMALYKISLSYMSKSILILLYAMYDISLIITKTTFVKKLKDESEGYYVVGMIVVVSSILYIIYSIRAIITNSILQYDLYVSICITFITFFSLIWSIIGARKARKRMNLEEETAKLISLATSLISLSLTPTAILSYTKNPNISLYTGIAGIVFGSISSLVGIYMMFYIKFTINTRGKK